MTTKQKDQFLCDYLLPGSTVSVDANWLQEQLRELKKYKRMSYEELICENQNLKREIREIRSLVPDYHLDVRA